MLSYSSLVNKGKITLPSVDSWGTNNNIMKDPPKSIMTRRIDKVTDNNDLVKMIDNSDRSSEAVMRFSRGVNPSVSVSYSNHGGSMQNFGNQQAFLPYRINQSTTHTISYEKNSPFGPSFGMDYPSAVRSNKNRIQGIYLGQRTSCDHAPR
jgi:hypothetical protein